MKLFFLGTCSGTEPFAGMHHCSWVLQSGGMNYWFDCGEGCAYTAHMMGINVLNNRAIFVSHPHPDHTCGLPHLFFVMKKLVGRTKTPLIYNNTLDIFFPGLETLQGAKIVCNTYEIKDRMRFDLLEHEMADGLLFEDENVRVSALHNRHMKEDGSRGWHSYSLLIQCEGKRIVYSGDVLDSEELTPLVAEGCDLLLHETGHHPVEKVCRFAAEQKVKALRFLHHGREIIYGREEAEKLVAEFSRQNGLSIRILSDQDTEEL